MTYVFVPLLQELLWTLAAANAILAPVGVPLQTPPNLSDLSLLGSLLDSGVSDWGGVSPVTLDFVNPEVSIPSLSARARVRATCVEASALASSEYICLHALAWRHLYLHGLLA